MLQLYVEQIEESFLISMEDFFVLPEFIRNQILSTKAALYQSELFLSFSYCVLVSCLYLTNFASIPLSGGAGGAVNLDYNEMVTQLINSMSDGIRPSAGARLVYVPLGSQELSALCRLYRVRLQTMSTASLFKSMSCVTVDECDPRAVPASDIHEFDRSQSRIVRLLNIKVHTYLFFCFDLCTL
jgi:hypothetical protein